MWLQLWLALGSFAMTMTLFWGWWSPTKRVYFSAGFGALAWLTMAWTAPGVERMTDAGETVSAGIGLPVQLFAGLLGVLSLAVVFLYRFNEYPPTEADDYS